MNDSFWVYVYPLPVKLALQFLSGKLTPRAVNVQRHPPFLFVCLHCFVSFLFGSRLGSIRWGIVSSSFNYLLDAS